MRILFDKNVPVGVRHLLIGHQVDTFVELGWHPQLENGKLLTAAESAGYDLLVTADQNIRAQQNLAGRKLAMVVLGSNIWPIVQTHATSIAECVNAATPGTYAFIEMPLPPRPKRVRR